MKKFLLKSVFASGAVVASLLATSSVEALSCWRMNYGGTVSTTSPLAPYGAVAQVPCPGVQPLVTPPASMPAPKPPPENPYYQQQRDYQQNNIRAGGSCSSTPTVYACSRKLGNPTAGAPGWGVFRHDYLCVQTSQGYVCGGQTTNNAWMYGGQSADTQSVWNPQLCKPVSRDSSAASCVSRAFIEPRPGYGLVGPGTNCQEWAKAVLDRCK